MPNDLGWLRPEREKQSVCWSVACCLEWFERESTESLTHVCVVVKSLWVTLIAIGFVLVFKAQLSGAKFYGFRSQNVQHLWEFGSHRLELTRTFFFQKITWLSPNLSPNLHLFGQLCFCIMWIILINITSKSLTKQIFKSPLVLIRLFWIFTETTKGPTFFFRPSPLGFRQVDHHAVAWCTLFIN